MYNDWNQDLCVQRWGSTLLHPAVNRPGEGCVALEQAAIMWSIDYRNYTQAAATYKYCTDAIREHTINVVVEEGVKVKSVNLVNEPDLLSTGQGYIFTYAGIFMIVCIQFYLLQLFLKGLNICRRVMC